MMDSKTIKNNSELNDGHIKRTLRKTFISLRNRNFRLFFIGQTISNTGNWLTNVALVLLVLKLTHSGLAVGLVSACQFGPILFLSAWAGAITDRVNKWKALLLTQILEMMQSIGLAILAFMPHTSLGGLYTLAIISGIILAFDNPLRRSFVTEMVQEEDVPNAIVLYSTIVNVSRIFGPALAGLLVVTLGYGWCFTIDAASYIAVIVCIVMMIQNDLHRQPLRPKTKGDVREGIRYILSIPVLWVSFVMLALIGTLSYNFGVTLPLFVINSLHGAVSTFTILYSIFSCGAVLSAFIFAKLGSVKINHIIFGAGAVGLIMLILASVSNIGIAFPLVFLLGLASMVYLNSTTTIIQVGTKREMHGRLLALQSVFLIGTGVIGGPLMGWVADALGARMPIILGGIVCLASAIFGYVAIKRYAPEKLLYIK